MAVPAARNERMVLRIEDDAALAQMYKLRLELDGHRVEVAPYGKEGLSKARLFEPDVILLDIALPGMDGLTLLDHMRADERLRDLPVLILTNHDEQENQNRAVELGARGFRSKSRTTPDDLARLVQRLSGSDRS